MRSCAHKVPTVYTLWSKNDKVHKVEKVTKNKLTNYIQTTCTSSYHDENTSKVSKRLVQNCKRSCAHKTPRVNVDGQTDGRMNKRTETCRPKSPMLKQVRQKLYFIFFFIWVLQPVKIISLILSRVNRKVG